MNYDKLSFDEEEYEIQTQHQGVWTNAADNRWGREQVTNIRKNEMTIDTISHDTKEIHAPILHLLELTQAPSVRRVVNVTSEIINKASVSLFCLGQSSIGPIQ